ncbi:MAG: 26S proteasome regulatory subunit N10 [Bacillariaceae sp.]|jgi:26S proteasome regulatory subunit N10
MPLESCMILLDNSEFMRNGDYVPTRLEAQQDAANLLVGAKTQSHPESTVGISAGTELLVSPTEDVGKLLNAVHDLQISRTGGGFGPSSSSSSTATTTADKTKKMKSISDITAAIQVASLALKHRKNKNGSQRIVLFVGSPLEEVDGRALAKAGRQLKKNNVSIDIVAMGEIECNEEKLKELVDAANGRAAAAGDEGAERSCHLVTIPAGVLPSDVLASSPIVHGGTGGSAFAASAAAGAVTGGDFGGSAGGGGGGGGDFGDFGGVDPNMDPELAMALRVSMEEERARQERMTAAAAAAAETTSGEESKDAEMQDAAAPSAASPSAMDLGLSEEEALLQQALAMSMNENEPKEGGTEDDTKPAATAAAASMDTEEDDEAAAMQLALQMSLQQAEEEGEGGLKTEDQKQQFQDPQFVNQLLGSLPGVNPNDPAIQSALQNMNKDDDDKKKDDDKKEEDKKE